MLRHRTMRKLHLKSSGELPFFQPPSSDVQDKHWQVSVVPERLQCRAVDLGDISPANTELFLKALNSPACGIQVTKTKVLNNKQGPLKFTRPPPPEVILGLLTWGTYGHTGFYIPSNFKTDRSQKEVKNPFALQTDLDDGHCPSWSNQLKGLYNIYQFVHGKMRG